MMKKYILFAVAIAIISMTAQMKADNSDNTEETPSRTEVKSFSNINDIKIDHKYGNIVMRESNAKNVELEIQYFDFKTSKASCEVNVKGNSLIINTITSSENGTTTTVYTGNVSVTTNVGGGAKINYILSVPKGVSMTTILKYGNMKASKIRGAFEANLSYSNLDVEQFENVIPAISLRYGDLSIREVSKLDLTVSYSNVNIKKIKTLDFSGSYNNFILGKVESMDLSSDSKYNKFSIDEISIIKCNIKYGHLTIGNLLSSAQLIVSYSNASIAVSSSKAKLISIDGAYSDIILKVEPTISASFESKIKYGDLIISKGHTTNYTEHTQEKNTSYKVGKVGTKSPTLNIKLTNKYSDIKIK